MGALVTPSVADPLVNLPIAESLVLGNYGTRPDLADLPAARRAAAGVDALVARRSLPFPIDAAEVWPAIALPQPDDTLLLVYPAEPPPVSQRPATRSFTTPTSSPALPPDAMRYAVLPARVTASRGDRLHRAVVGTAALPVALVGDGLILGAVGVAAVVSLPFVAVAKTGTFVRDVFDR